MKDKLKKKFNDNKWVLITFLTASIIISIIYILNKVSPFGNNSLLTIDFYHQYGPMLNELVDRVNSGETLLYSLNTAGGIPFFRNFLNYLSSPFNIVLFLFKKENIVTAFSVVIALKAIFASGFMSYFLKKAFKKDGVLVTIFSVLYAFSGYFCAYYWNIMWLDGMVFLPLITLGVIKIIDEQKPLLYLFSLSIMLFANYFISYMICIFEVLFFIGYFIYKNNFKLKNILRKCLMFAVCSLLAAGLVAFLLIPLYESLSSISATSDTFPELSLSFNVLNYYFNHLTGTKQTVFASDTLVLPNVCAGLITLFSLIILFFNKNIKIKIKILALISLLFFLICFDVNVIDFIWHAFHVPNDLPWRYSFIYVFLITTLGYYSLSKINDVKHIFIFITFGFLIIFTFLSVNLNFTNMDSKKVIVCFIFLIIYSGIYLLYQNKKIPRNVLNLVFLSIISVEVIYAINVNWDINHDIDTFMSDKDSYTELINKVKKDDNGLYRIEKTNLLTLNDGAWYDYYGISTFSSMAYEDVAKTQRMLGLSGNNINSYYYQYYQTPIYNTMFNVKYILGNYIENDYYVPIDSKDTYNLIGYNYSSSVGFSVNDSIKNMVLVTDNPFFNQSNFVKLLVGDKEVYEPISIKDVSMAKLVYQNNGNSMIQTDGLSDKFKVILDNPKKQNIYLYINGSEVSSFYVNGSYYSVSSDEYYTVDIGKMDEGEVSLEINLKESSSSVSIYAYSINDEVFKEFYDKVQSSILNVTSYNETVINGNITVKENKTVFTSLAYDEGFSVYVDGEKIETFKVLNSYLAFDLEEGYHDIKIKYYPKGLKEGLVITGISALALILYVIFDDDKKHKKTKKDKISV